jgi:hypothetical protein
MAQEHCSTDDTLTLLSSTDDGLYEETHGPENAIDQNFDPESRWSNLGQGEPKHLLIDLGAIQTVRTLGIAWYKGDQRKATFSINSSIDGQEFRNILSKGQSSGKTADLEVYAFEPIQAQFLRISADGNDSNEWNSIVEVKATGCGVRVEKPSEPVLTARQNTGLFGLDPSKKPGENFDLLGWYVTTPADDNNDGKSDSVYENELAAGWTDERYFYTDPTTGGMVFRVTPAGAKTSKNTQYTRTELRQMLRRGDYSINTREQNEKPNKNNWVFSSAPLEARFYSGGVDGVMTATLAVNQVTRQGKNSQIGRVIIGQIHAKNDEPIRLYYRKLPGNKNGSIYFVHDPEVGKERSVNVIGSRSDRALNPLDGIALDEFFSYEIKVTGQREGDETIPYLHLKITKEDGSEFVIEPFDMRDSGFSSSEEFMFFKAGAYTGNNTSPYPERDFDMVTFYELDYTHDPAPKGGWIEQILKKEQLQREKDLARAAALAAEKTPPNPAKAGVIISDSFTDGERDGGADAKGGIWWTTSATSAIEIEPGKLGLVSGTSGRGIRTTFKSQTLADGQTLVAKFIFDTPETVGFDRQDALRVGLHDRLGRTELEADLQASSGAPNQSYNGLPGYMVTFDVNREDPKNNNVDVRRHIPIKTIGRLMGTYKGYDLLGEGGKSFTFEANKTYTGEMRITKTKMGLDISGILSDANGVMTKFNHFDEGSIVNNFGMLSFHVNSKSFGASNTPNKTNNGITFTNVTIEIVEK